jgi:hypothetical protein
MQSILNRQSVRIIAPHRKILNAYIFLPKRIKLYFKVFSLFNPNNHYEKDRDTIWPGTQLSYGLH